MVAVEYGKESHQMGGGIDRRTVKHDEGLAGVATSDVYSGIEFSRCLYSRYQLECAGVF